MIVERGSSTVVVAKRPKPISPCGDLNTAVTRVSEGESSMHKEIAEKWATKLSSGEISQGKGSLGLPDGRRCCLGVLCDMAAEAGVIEKPIATTDGEVLLYDDSYSVLPDSVMDWAGMRMASGVYNGKREALTADNDSGMSFVEIAKIIREYVEEL